MAEAFEVAAWLKSLPCAPEFRPSEAEFADPISYICKIEAEARSYGICKIIPPFPRATKKTVMANLNRSLLLQSPDSTTLDSPEFDPRRMGGCMPAPVGRNMSGFSHPKTRSSLSPSSTDTGAKFNTRCQQLGCGGGAKRSKVPVQPVPLAQKLVWQSGESYTLEQFEAKARQFARARLKTSKDLPPLVIESLFWKAAADRSVTVEYGNDIPGSAFGEPSQQAMMYATSQRKRKRGLELHGHGFPLEYPLKVPKMEAMEEDPGPFQANGDSQPCTRSMETDPSSETYSRGQLPSPLKERLRPRRNAGLADDEGAPGWKLANSYWNMRVMARSPGSLLRYMPDEVPGVTSPMVYIGMLFSWFAWHVEDHELHSLNYLHTGAPKTWYAVPGDAAPALEEVVRVYGYGNISDAKAAFALLGEKTTVMSPEVLCAAGVPCCRLVQNAGEFVVTFPRAYHQGFSHGFNCGEAANFASSAWLEVAKEAATRRAAMNYLPMLSHQQLLYLLALSYTPRVPFGLPFESGNSQVKDKVHVSGEETVKTVFTNDVAHNNRLLGLLVDTGVSGCVLLSEGGDFSPALSEELKLPCSAADNDFKASSFMTDMLVEEIACKKVGLEDDESGIKTQGLITSTVAQDMPLMHIRWGTLPCAACGLLCFPSMAIVQPASNFMKNLASAQHSNKSKDDDPVKNDAPDESCPPDFSTPPISEPIHSPVSSLAYGKLYEELDEEHTTIQAFYVESSGGILEGLQAELRSEICDERIHNNPCSNGKLLATFSYEKRGMNGTEHFVDGSKEYAADLEQETAEANSLFCCKKEMHAVSRDENENESRKFELKMQANSEDKSLLSKLNGNVDTRLFPEASSAHSLENSCEDLPVIAETMSIESRSPGAILKGCINSSSFENSPSLEVVGETTLQAKVAKGATSVLELLAVTYEDETEDSGPVDGSEKTAITEAEHDGICFHPHSSVVPDDEVGCTVDAPWHYATDEIASVTSLDGSDEVQRNESSVAMPINELDKFVCKEVLVQLDDGTYMITDCMPKVEACPPVHDVLKSTLKESRRDGLKGSLVALQSGDATPRCQKAEDVIFLQKCQPTLGVPCMSTRDEGLLGDSETIVQVEMHAFDKPTVHEGISDPQSDDTGSPAVENSAQCLTLCVDTHRDEVTCGDNKLSDSNCTESRKGLGSEDHLVTCRISAAHSFHQAGTANALITIDSNKTDRQAEDDINDSKTFCEVSATVHKPSLLICDTNGVDSKTLCEVSMAEKSTLLIHANGVNQFRGKVCMSEERSAFDIQNNNVVRKQENRSEIESGDLCMLNEEIWKVPASNTTNVCNSTPQSHCKSASSSTIPSPCFFCLEHALEARHQLKLLGGSYMVLVCHSDIAKIEQRARFFGEELNLSHAWRCVSFRKATNEENHFINMALNAEEEGESSNKDWVVQLGMSVRHLKDITRSNHSHGLYKDLFSSPLSKRADMCYEEEAEPFHTVDVDGENHVTGKLSNHMKISVAGRWCGKVWMNNQVHPVLGGCYPAQTPLQAFSLSIKDIAEYHKALAPEQMQKEVLKGREEGLGDMGLETPANLETERSDNDWKSCENTGNLSKVDSGSDVPNERKRRDLAADCRISNEPYVSSGIQKTTVVSSCEDHPMVTQGFEDCRRKWCIMESLDGNICATAEFTKSVNNQDYDMAAIDHDGSDVDIWRDLDVGCYSQEVMSLDAITEVADTPLIVEPCHQMDAEVQENLLIPGMLRRRRCSVFDGEAQARSLGQEGDCAVSAFAECTIGEALHDVLEPSIAESSHYTMGSKRKQRDSNAISIKRVKDESYSRLDMSNLATVDFDPNTLGHSQATPFFERPGNFNVSLVNEVNAGNEHVSSDKMDMHHRNIKQASFDDSEDAEQFSLVPQFEMLRGTLGRVKIPSGATQWKLKTAPNSPPLLKWKKNKQAGKISAKLRKQVKWDDSYRDAPNSSLDANESTEEDILLKRIVSKGHKKNILDELPFDCTGFFGEGPSTRLRTRNAAKIINMDDDDDEVINGEDNDALLVSSGKQKRPRQRAKKPTVRDIEEEPGAYICELDGCSMSFASKQELNLHKRNTCTFVGCGKRFGSHKYLLQHRRVHLDDRPLKCPWNGCKMTFKWKWACTEHYRVHTGERPYVCPIPECGRTFRFVSDFSRHKRKTGHAKQL